MTKISSTRRSRPIQWQSFDVRLAQQAKKMRRTEFWLSVGYVAILCALTLLIGFCWLVLNSIPAGAV